MKKTCKIWLCALLVLTLLLQLTGTVQPVSAEKSSAEIQKEIDSLKSDKEAIEKELSGIRDKLSSNMESMEDIVAQKNLIDQEVFLLFSQVSNINDQIAAYSDLIADKQEALDQAQEHLTQLQAQNKERIRAMEKNGGLSYWSVIFKANSFMDLLDRLKMVQEIAEADKRRLEEMSQAADEVAAAKTALEQEKTTLEATRKDLEKTQADLEVKRAEADKLLSELVAKGQEYEALVEEAEAEAGKIKQDILDKEAEYDEAKDREYQEWLASQPKPQPPSNPGGVTSGGVAGSGNTVGNVTWLTPINYTAFTSPFGWRMHPVYHEWRFHYGVDLAAPSGTPIVASRSGVVSTASYDGSSGYHVYINHQDGYVTRYLHMTHYVVSPGQYVSAGQVIGYCGSTGASTGPHLHFSVYYNGVAVNPADYINI